MRFHPVRVPSSAGFSRGHLMLPLAVMYLAASLAAHTAVIVHLPALLQLVALTMVFCAVFVACRPPYMGHLFFFMAFSLPFFGMPPYQLQNIFFEFFLSLVSLLLAVEAFRGGPVRSIPGILHFLLICYGLLALLSLLLLPFDQTMHLATLWGPFDFSEAVLQSTPGSALYPFAAVGRLFLFLVFGYLLARSPSAGHFFASLFKGLVAGVFLASCIGLLKYYHLLSLEWFLPASAEKGRLQSLLGNPGWFAEFVVVSIPFVFVLMEQTRKGWRPVWCGLVLISFIAVVLTGSRTAWLLYPLVLGVGWGVYSCGKRSASGNARGKAFRLAVMVCGNLVLLLLMLVAGIFFILLYQGSEGDEGLLQQRLAHMTNVGMRENIWRDAIALGLENPVIGRGYESYKYQALTLAEVPESRYSRQHERVGFVADTPHNLYLQLFVGNGFVGLGIWCMVISSLLLRLYHDFRVNGRCTSFAVFCSVVVFHLYGLTQSMQYIGVVWLIIFLAIFYATTISPRVLPSWGRRMERLLAWGSGILLCIGGIGYAANYQSHLLAEKYDLRVYGPDQHAARFAGFFPVEQWGGRPYRWSGRRAVIEYERHGVVVMNFFCNAPRMATDPVVLDVFLDGAPLDRVTFWRARTVSRKYFMAPNSDSGDSRLELHVSRTWNPRQEGVTKDSRNLGVAVSGPYPDTLVPAGDLGFYGWQVSPRGQDTEDDRVLPFRWSHWQALLHERRQANRWPLLLVKSQRPFLERHPLVVTFLQENREVASLRLTDRAWNEVVFSRFPVARFPLVIRVQWPWNPRREGYGDDPRDLGVAVALLPSAGRTTQGSRKEKNAGNVQTEER